MLRRSVWLFGKTQFQEREEFLEFRFKFLLVLMLGGAVFTLLFVLGTVTSVNRIAIAHVYSMCFFTLSAFLLWLALRGHPERFIQIAWTYEAICMLEYSSALLFVPEDELRILWFYINIPGVYILLGQRAGMIITALTVIGLALFNPLLSRPYSSNAMATALVSMVYLGLFFHVFADRSISYFVRMRESNDRLHRMATHDPLTDLYNARAYYEMCDQVIRMAKRSGEPYSVLFIDLDHFKSINDRYGHAVGDLVLQSAAATLSRHIRESDLLGRVGGEEFSIMLPNTDAESASTVAEHLRGAIEGMAISTGDQVLRITASIGVARNQHSDQSMQDIQQQADEAMYRAKAAGRNRVSCFEHLSDGLPVT